MVMASSGAGALRVGRGALGGLPNDPGCPSEDTARDYLDKTSVTGEQDVGGVGAMTTFTLFCCC
jgi:hypothetical protein